MNVVERVITIAEQIRPRKPEIEDLCRARVDPRHEGNKCVFASFFCWLYGIVELRTIRSLIWLLLARIEGGEPYSDRKSVV